MKRWVYAAVFGHLAVASTFSADRPALADSSSKTVVVTATRVETPSFDLPASIDRLDGDLIREGRLQANLSESLGSVPGLTARDRQNYAQDVQISIRGFGARATFGIRGVRAYVDGIPATLPDGQGQVSNVDLGSAGRIEILRGPFSALYGNSSGGVIQIFTEEGSGQPVSTFSVAKGSDNILRPGFKLRGGTDAFGYVASLSHFQTEGYRDHSQAERNIGNLKLTIKLDERSKLTLIANRVELPEAQDPLGLTRTQFEANPRGVDPVALQFDTRKTVEQTQGGATYERRINTNNSVQAMVYYGSRSTEQFQAIPVGPQQANPLHPGGVISLERDYSGVDAHWTARFALFDSPMTLTAGFNYDLLDEQRRGYQNFVGNTLGVKGSLRRDEDNTVDSFDQYLQASWQLDSRWTLNAGVRHSSIDFESDNRFVVAANGDGSPSYSATLPVIGLLYTLNESVHLYATAGRGFETPTLNELAYRPDGQTGLNLALRSARSDNGELGVKMRLGRWGDATLAAFETRTENEIVTQTNVGGRSTFQNAGATRRKGAELGWSTDFAGDWYAQASYTWLDAYYRDGFATCTGSPCASPNQTIAAGNAIPGVARETVYATLAWRPERGLRAGLEGRHLSRVYVNDLNSDAAGSYATASVYAGYVRQLGPWEFSGFARIDNLFDRQYAGSVIVNEGNGRYFEPAPGRTWLAGISGAVTF